MRTYQKIMKFYYYKNLAIRFLIKKNKFKIEKEYPILIHLPQSYPININKSIEKIKSKLSFSKIFL